MFTNAKVPKEWLLMLVLGGTLIYALVVMTRVSLSNEFNADKGNRVSVIDAVGDDTQKQVRLAKELIQTHVFYKQKIANYETNIKKLNEQIMRLQEHQHKAKRLADSEELPAGNENAIAKVSNDVFLPFAANNKQLAIELDQHLANESYDSEWAETIENRMASVITEDLQEEGNELVEATCRTSICRIEISHESELAEQKFLVALGTRSDLINSIEDIVSYRVSAEESGDGVAHSVFFIARQGQKLPVS